LTRPLRIECVYARAARRQLPARPGANPPRPPHRSAPAAELVVTGNIGCFTQIQSHLRKLGREIPVLHTLELLERAYSGGPILPER